MMTLSFLHLTIHQAAHAARRRLACKALAILLLPLIAGCENAQPEGCKLGHVTDLTLTYQQGHILIPASLNGVETNMILDTGAQGTMVTRAAATRLALPLTFTGAHVSGVGGSRSLYLFYARSFRLGELHGEHLPLTVSAATFEGYDRPVDGLFGADFLSAYDIDFDLRNHRARLFTAISGCSHPSALLDEPLFQAELVRGPVGDASPFVRVEIGGKTLLAVVDTGAPHTVIFRNAARKLGVNLDSLANDPHFTATGVGPYARAAARHVMAPITVGEITISNLPVAIVDERMPEGIGMLLGMDFLARVHVWLSFSSRTMIMQYPPKASPPLPK
jgi:clan AA aspartic protease (TIGR02281 family)